MNRRLRTAAAWAGVGLAMPMVVMIFGIRYGGLETFLWPLHFLRDRTLDSGTTWHVLALSISFLGNAALYGAMGYGVAVWADKEVEASDGR